MRIDFELELSTDVSVSASARTVGEARCLDYLPGRTLLGVAAKVLYGQDHPRCFDIFQRGTVRFLDAVPLIGGFRVAPTPRSWQQSKYGNTAYDLASGHPPPAGVQFKGCTDTWRDEKRNPLAITRHTTLRAAMQPNGRTRDGFLYAMESLPAGLVLHACIVGPEEDVQSVAAALQAEEVFIGRSRGAEYGRVRVRVRDAAPRDLLPSEESTSSTLHVLCRSRVCFRSAATGMPSLVPHAQEDFGLPQGWELDLASSVLRLESYSPFHGKRRRPDLEHQVLQRGSVLTFRAGPGASQVRPADIAARTAAGVGIWRNCGLGEVSIQPTWLGVAHLDIPTDPVNALAPRAQPEAPPSDALFQWMTERHETASARREAASSIEKEAAELAKLRVSASQWGEVRRFARDARLRRIDDNTFREEVLRHVTTGVSSLKRAWGREVGAKKASDFLRDALNAAPPGVGASAWAEAIAARVVRLARQGDQEARS